MIFLDTHIIVWLYTNEPKKISPAIGKYLGANKLVISPIVLLELTYLFEVRKIAHTSEQIFNFIHLVLGITVEDQDWKEVTQIAQSLHWTRDVFDRYIVAQAQYHHATLITKDQNILSHYVLALSPDVKEIHFKN